MMVAGLWEVMFLKDVITYRLPMLTMASLSRPSELLRKNKRVHKDGRGMCWGVFKRSWGELEVDMAKTHCMFV